MEGLKDMGVHSKIFSREFRICALGQMLTSKGLGPYGGEGFLAEGSSRYTEQDEARHDDSGNDSSKTKIVLASR